MSFKLGIIATILIVAITVKSINDFDEILIGERSDENKYRKCVDMI